MPQVYRRGINLIDRVRVDEANRLKQDKKARKGVKTARRLLLLNSENVKGDDMLRLQELLEANRNLLMVYLLKDDLKQLWRLRCIEEAELFNGSNGTKERWKAASSRWCCLLAARRAICKES